MVEIVEHAQHRVAGAPGPVYLLLFPVPVVCFVLALFTDITYSATAYLMWLHFSEWLIAAGLAFGAIAALVLLMDFATSHALRTGALRWMHLILFNLALVVEIFNAFVHTIDGWTAVVPTGMILSIVGAILALGAVGSLLFAPTAWVQHREVRR